MGKVSPVPVMLVARSLITAPPGAILLVRRSSSKRFGGLWEAPGGKAEPGEMPDLTRAREVIDEVALVVKAVSELVFVKSRLITELSYNVLYLALFNVSKVVSGEVRISNEHDCFAWVPYADLGNYALTPETALAIQGLASLLPQ